MRASILLQGDLALFLFLIFLFREEDSEKNPGEFLLFLIFIWHRILLVDLWPLFFFDPFRLFLIFF